ncbi:phage tail protein [Cellulomonas sp. Marseille-Q8402]
MEPFLGEIRMFAIGFVPANWLACDGSLLPINQNAPLYSLLGVTYGGDGRSTFALPDLRGRFVVHPDPAVGRLPGHVGGSETVTLLPSQLPAHGHSLSAAAAAATATSPSGGTWAASTGPAFVPATTAPPSQPMSPLAVTPAGGFQPHENRPPFTVLRFAICTSGTYPTRS